MKIQCNCGAKYAFDVTPEMANSPIRFVCQTCGQDSSELVNQLIRQQLGPAPAAAAVSAAVAPPVVIAPPPSQQRAQPAVAPLPAPVAALVPPAAPPRVAPAVAVRVASATAPQQGGSSSSLRVSAHGAAAEAAAAAPAVSAAEMCVRHTGQLVAQRCRVCQKPMCPKCMESFGYVCSAYCKGKAESQGIDLPRYAGQRQFAESKQSRRIGLIIGGTFAAVALVLGAWGWYAWVGSVPKVAFSLRLPELGHSGQLRILPDQQAVYLHAGTLSRHDMKGEKEVWLNVLIDKKQINDRARAEFDRQKAQWDKVVSEGGDISGTRIQSFDEVLAGMLQEAAGALHLHIREGNIWVSFPDHATRFDWETGKPAKEIPVSHPVKRVVCNGDELVLASEIVATRVNLLSGESQELLAAGSKTVASPPLAKDTRSSSNTTGRAGDRVASSASRTNAAQSSVVRAQNVSKPARLAAPAVAAANANQQRLTAAMSDPPAAASGSAPASGVDTTRVVAERHGVFQVTGVPAKPGQYQVSVRRLGGEKSEWSGEMPGWPEVLPLKTVDVVAGGKSIVVLDKAGKKRWEAQLTRGAGMLARPAFSAESDPAGDGPFAEHGDAVYFYDSSELTAFDLAAGGVRWKFDAVGTSGLLFDDQGMLYVNATTAGSAGGEAHQMVFKVDAMTGKALWHAEREGLVGYASGKFVYTVESYVGDRDDADGLPGVETVFHVPAFVRIRRLEPDTGRVIWNHHQPRFPLDVQFDKNSIHLLFKKEVQVLKFISL